MWLIVRQLPMKLGCWDTPLAIRDLAEAIPIISENRLPLLTENNLQIPSSLFVSIICNWGLFETSRKYLTLLKTVFQVLSSKNWVLFKKYCLKLPRTVWDFREVFDTSENFLRVLGIVWDFWELFQVWKFWELSETCEKCLALSRIVWNFWEIFESSENCLRLSENTAQKHCGKTKEIVNAKSGLSGPLYKSQYTVLEI